MAFLRLNPDKSVDVLDDVPSTDGAVQLTGGYEIPATYANGKESTQFGEAIANILGEIAERELTEKHGRPTSGMIMPPDSWLIIVAGLICDGIIQGMAWDAVKIGISQAIASMQAKGVAPASPTDRKTKTDTRVNWSSYLEFGNLLKLKNELEVRIKRD